MLNIIWGRAGSGKTTRLLKELMDNVNGGSEKNIMLVPETFSHDCERLLAKVGGASVSLSAEVLSFGRLSDRVFAKHGGLASPILNESGRLLNLRLAVDTVFSELKAWKNSAKKESFLTSLLKTIDECKCYGITPEMLADICSKNEKSNRLFDLAIIFSTYNHRLNFEGDSLFESSIDPRDRITLLNTKLNETDFTKDVSLFIDGFVTFTPQEINVIHTFVRKGKNVFIALCGNPEHGLFLPLLRTQTQLIKDSVNIIDMGQPTQAKAFGIRELEKVLLNLPTEQQNENDSIDISCSANMHDECYNAAADIANLVKSGCRYSDIVVILPEMSHYRPHIENAFSMYGISYFTDVMDEIDSSPIITFLNCIFSIALQNWRLEDVVSLLHTNLLRKHSIRLDLLEEYIRLWNINGSQWKKEWTLNPEGFGQKFTDNSHKLLKNFNRFRQLMVDSLQDFKGRKTCKEWVICIVNLFDKLDVHTMIAKRVKALQSVGEKVLADKTSQIWGVLLSVFEQMITVLGDEPFLLTRFVDLLMVTISCSETGSIPVTLDYIVVSEAGRLRRNNAKIVFCLGCTQENMPKTSKPDSLLTLEDKILLESLDTISLPPNDEQRYQRELFNIYTSLTLADEKLYLSYAQDKPADVVDRVAKIFNITTRFRSLVKWGCNENDSSDELETISVENVKALYSDTLKLSPSKIEAFYKCPYAYFCKFGLELKEPVREGVQSNHVGTFFHFVLEKTGKYISEQSSCSSSDVKIFAQTCSDEYMKEYEVLPENYQKFFKYLKETVTELAVDLRKDLSNSKFKAGWFELRLDKNDSVDVTGTDFKMKLNGVVDRLDYWKCDGKTYIKIVDYKSGMVKFQKSKIELGMSMQMPMYLFSVLHENNRKLLSPDLCDEKGTFYPAGVLYVKTKDAICNANGFVEDTNELRNDELKYDGMLLEDEHVLNAMGISQYDTGLFPVKFNAAGTGFDKRASRVQTVEQWEELEVLVDQKVTQAVNEIVSGNVSVTPLLSEDPCLYCDYKSCCTNEQLL